MDNVLEFSGSNSIEQEAATWMVILDGDSDISSSEKKELQRWMARSPAHRDELERLAELWGMLNVLTVLAVPLEKNKQSLGQRLWATVSTQLNGLSARLNPTRGFATAAILGLGITALAIYLQGPAFDASNGLYQTTIGQQSTTVLSDNSSIMLNTNSQVRVEYSDQGRKITLLKGEAHFDVAPNKKVPFQVYAGDGLVQAVGTAFTVYLQQDEVVKVTVTEGKVKVLGETNDSGAQSHNQPTSHPVDLATLKAGQIATLERMPIADQPPSDQPANQSINKASYLQTLESIDQQELDRQLAWHKGLVMFAGETLEQVVHEISRYSDLKIQIADPSLSQLKIGGQFRIGQTQAMFDVLESNFNIQVSHLQNGQVSLSAGQPR